MTGKYFERNLPTLTQQSGYIPLREEWDSRRRPLYPVWVCCSHRKYDNVLFVADRLPHIVCNRQESCYSLVPEIDQDDEGWVMLQLLPSSAYRETIWNTQSTTLTRVRTGIYTGTKMLVTQLFNSIAAHFQKWTTGLHCTERAEIWYICTFF